MTDAVHPQAADRPVEPQLQPSPEPAPTVAWWLPGREPSALLDRLATAPGLGEKLSALQLLPLPAGWVVLHPQQALPRPSDDALPLGRRGRLLYPAGGRLQPAPRPDEDTEGPWRWVLLDPSREPVGFEAGDVLRVADLLDDRCARDARARWTAARAGAAPSAQLRSIEALPTSIEDALRRQLGDPPRSPTELLGKAPCRAANPLLRALGHLILFGWRMAPGGASAPTWIDRLGARAMRWVGDHAGMSMQRFLELLQKDPDKALHYAPALGNDASHRGITTFGGLFPHGLDFSLPWLSRGGGAAGLDLGMGVFQSLQQRYRELAEQAERAGNHRRAAYIYAHLLRDATNAARVLEAGQCFAEAALLLRDKLNNHAAAARCFAAAGRYAEAARCCEKVKDLLGAGHNWRQAGDDVRADTAFEDALQHFDQCGNQELAGNIALEHLDDRGRATQLWRRGYRAGNSRDGCAQCLIETLVDSELHVVRDEFVAELATCTDAEAVRAARTLAQLVRRGRLHRADSAAARWVECVEDTTRVLTERGLRQGGYKDRRHLLRSLADMRPDDPQLNADCKRLDERMLPPAPPGPPRVKNIRVRSRRPLPLPTIDRRARPDQGRLHGDDIYLGLPLPSRDGQSATTLVCCPIPAAEDGTWVWAHPLGDDRQPPGESQPSPDLPWLDLSAETGCAEQLWFVGRRARPSTAGYVGSIDEALALRGGVTTQRLACEGILAIAEAEDGPVIVRVERDELILDWLDADLRNVRSTRHGWPTDFSAVSAADLSTDDRARRVCVHDSHVALVIEQSFRNLLIALPSDGAAVVRDLGEAIVACRFAADGRLWLVDDRCVELLDPTDLQVAASGELQGRQSDRFGGCICAHPAGLLVWKSDTLTLYAVSGDRVLARASVSPSDAVAPPNDVLDLAVTDDWRRVRLLLAESLIEFELS